MPRPGDWDAIGLGGDPTPGDPEKIKALAEGFQKMGGKAREIITAIEAVMNKNDDSVFVGQTAEALRGKVDGRLRGHVESVASAFESSATALREWSAVVVEQQAKADAALNAGRGMAEDDPERETHKTTAQSAGTYQSEQASSYAGRINGVSDIKMPISDCEVFWEAFKWLAIILIIPALIFGGPIALIALGVNLALFIKTIVDVAKGDASFLDLFLAGLGLIAPTTKALPIFSIVKAIGKGIGAGVKGIVQTFKNVFSKDFLFNGLLAGLKSMPMLANIAIKETGLFVVKNIRNFPLNAANFGNNFGKIALNGIKNLGTGFANLPGTLFRGLTNIGKGFATGLGNTFKFVGAHFGNLQWTRIFLPVAADEIRAFRLAGMTDFGAFTQALKVGVIGRGLQGKNLFGMPMTSAIGKSIAGIPIETTGGALGGKTNFLHTMMNPPEMIPLNIKGIGEVSGAGFNAGHVTIAIDDIPTGNFAPVRGGDLGVSVHTPTVTTPGGIHIPSNAGTNVPVVPGGSIIPSAHVGTPQMPANIVANLTQPAVGTPVLPIHIATGATPPSVHVQNPHLGANGVVANIPSPHVGTPEFGNSLHMNNVNVQSPGLNNIGSLHVPTPNANSAGLSDLAGSAIRNNAPAVSPHFGTSIGEGAAHGFQTNHFKLSIDEVLNAPSPANFNGLHALNPPAVDRINAALDLVHNPGATTHGVTPPTIHTAKPAGTDVNVNVHLNGGDFKTPAPTTMKIDNPGLAGAQNAPTVPSVNVQPINLPSRATDLHVQPTTVHNTGQGTTLPSTNLPGDVGVPGHGINAHSGLPETQLVPLHPQPAPAVHGNPAINNPGINVHNPGVHGPGVHDPGYSLAKGADIGNSGHGTNTIASRSEIQLHGLTDRPGAYVKVERTEGGMSSYNLYGGGPDGRMDVLAQGNLRFTDTATGQTTRFDSGGIVIDQGLRLTKTDGVLRPGDHIVVAKPGGEFRATSLTGEIAPDIKITKLDNGGIQLVDEKGVTFHYNAQGKLENQPLSAAWDQDLAAKAGVFHKPGDTDAMVNAKMSDFGQVQRAQAHYDTALENVAVHGHRVDGPSTGPAVGDQVHLDLHAAEADLSAAKTSFQGKHGLDPDGIQQQLDNLLLDSLKDRPRLVGGVSRSFDLPGGAGMKFELNGAHVSFSGPKADAFSSSMNGRVLTIVETGAGGKAAHTWTYSLGFGGRANQIGESFPLNGGLFDGQPISLEGKLGTFDKAMVQDLKGNQLPVKVGDDGFVVPSPQGPMAYDKAGTFRALDRSATSHLPKPVPPPHLAGDDLIRWNAQADISRTHLTVAAENKTVDLLMKDVAGGSFTSKKGFEGYVNPTALADGTLVAKVHTFESVAKDLAFKGPEDNITLYRGVSMDPASAKVNEFTERLPISTSNTMKFQDDWAKNGVNSNRVIFEIDVPPGHSKLSMAYPEGYKPVKGDAPEVNASQFEVTLAPTTFVRTGPNRTLDNGMTIIPVKAEQIPPSAYESVITAKWPGMSSETAFGDFAKSFELGALRQFPDLENVTSKSLQSTDGLTHTVTVSKPGFEGHDLTITVMRDPKADTVRVTIASDGANKFDQTWTKTDFSNIATDLRGGVLHNNEKFTNFPKPWQWEKATPFRGDGLTEAQVLQRMDDWAGVEKAQIELDSIKRDFGPQTGRVDGSSKAPSVGDQAKLEIHLAEQQLAEAKATFTQLHNLDANATADWLAALRQSDLKLNPGLLGASGRPGRGINLPGAGDVQLVRGGGGYKLSEGADGFRMQTGADGNMVVQKLGAGDVVLHSWTLRPGFRPSVIGETLTLGDGPLAGKFLDLQGTAGKLDGVIDDVRGGLPVKAEGDGIVVAAPGGVFKYDRDGFFQGPGAHPGDQLGAAGPPPHLSGPDATRWTAQADLSRTHLGDAATNKPVENLMKDVAGGSFTSKKGYGGFVNPTALEDGTLLGKMQNFHTVTQDLLTKGPADNITLYRGVSMDPAAAKAGEFTERLPISTSSSVKFQDEWAKNGVNSNRVVFEIDVPPAHNKLSMSYPEGYKPGAGEAKAWNQDQFEVTLAPTTFVRTGPNRTLDNGITVIPVKAEMIPPSAYNDVINQKWGGLDSATAFDDFAKSFELNALRQFPDLESVTSKSVLSGDGMINKITVSKPGFEGHDMHITVTRDVDADSVRVTVDVDGATKFDKSWSGQQFSNLATDLRGGVLHNNEQFTNLPQPARWAEDAAPPVHIDVKGKGKAVDQGLGNDLASLNRNWDNDVASLNKAWADDIEAFNKAWADDLAAKTNVFRKVGDTDAIVDARMADFSRVEHAQGNVKAALDDIAQHGGRLDGASTRPEIGEQAHLQLSAAETDLANAKAAFEGKHGMKVDGIQQQLDNLLLDSLKERPRLPGAGMRRPMPISGTDGMFKIEGNSVNFLGDSAGDFRGVLDGTALTVTKVDAEGNVLRTLSYQLNDLGWPMMKTDQLVLHGGGDVFDGRALTAEWSGGSFGRGAVDDLGGNVPVKYNTGEGEYSVPSMSGTQVYDRSGTFVRVEAGAKGKLADPIPPIHLEGDDLTRWMAQADISRTHLAAAGKYDYIGDMMQMTYEGRFTSQKGFGGYIDPYVLETGVTKLTKDVHTFNEVAEGLLFDGPIAPTTVYRGIAIDSASAQADKFIERLPVSTSSNWEFQKTWAQGADPGKRVVFQIDVPPAHGKLALSYPEGYQQGLKDARAFNPDQLEVTLSPTVLERTGDSFVKDGLTVIPVRARQIPAGQLDNLINERWPGMSSADAFDDFGRAFEQVNLQKFANMSDVTATSKVSTDGMVREITVSKPGLPGHDLTIKITRNEFADSVHVTVTADGKISLNRNWSQTEFSSIATDLRAGTLHQNDLFVGMSKPAEWNKPTSFSPQWDADLAAKANVFRRPGDTDAMVDVKMEDFSRFQQTEMNLKHAQQNLDLHGGRPDGPSAGGVSVGDQVRLDLHTAQADLDTATIGFKRKYEMDPGQLQDDLGGLAKKAKLPGAGRAFEVPGGGVSYQVENGVVHFTGTRAGEFTGAVNGREITVTQLGTSGDAVASWTFRQGFGRPNLTGQTIHLADGPLAGEVANLKGLMGQLDGTLKDGGVWPMKVVGDELFVATPGGPVRYGRDGVFHGPAPTSTSHLPQPTLPGNLHGDPVRWTNQVDLSRTHLTAAAENKAVENLMKDVMGGSFTSKRGFEGYVNPLALEDGTLLGKTQAFADVTRDLLLKGGDRDITLYRGVSMDPASAKAKEFVDRLPSSTSNNLKFQEEWAKNGVSSNRFVFEIDVPAGHGKLSMSYPPGYQAGLDEARAWNQSQWEVTLAPTTLVRTGPNRFENGMTIIPVKAEAIAPSAYADLITAKWPGMKSADAFTDFAKSFERDNLRKFAGLEDITATTVKRADSLSITATKPGFEGDLKITVLRDAEADSIRVTVASDGMTTFDQTWSKTDFKHLATDLRGNVLHNNDLFAGRMEPSSWKNAAATPATEKAPIWDGDRMARMDVLHKVGDSDASLTVRMDDFTGVQQAQADFNKAAAKFDDLVSRADGSSKGVSVGDQAKLDLQTAQHNLDVAKDGFSAKHGMQFDGLQQQLDDLLTGSLGDRPRIVAAGRDTGPGPVGNVRANPMAGGPTRMNHLPGDLQVKVQGGQAQIVSGLDPSIHLHQNGNLVTLTKTAPDGITTMHSWEYQVMRNASLNLTGESVQLTHGGFGGRMLQMADDGQSVKVYAGTFDDGLGNHWPVKANENSITIASEHGAQTYDRSSGVFQHLDHGVSRHSPAPVVPQHLTDADAAARWTGSVELSRTHLNAASTDPAVLKLMSDVRDSAFTSQRGYGGFVDLVQHDADTLVEKVDDFVRTATDLAFHGPNSRITVYRGMSLDPLAAQADNFVERLPSSTSNGVEFQHTWAQNGDKANRVVFEIDVPADHAKLASAYPPHYEAGPGDARPINPTQFEVTLAPTKLVRTGENRIQDGLTIIPVKAEQLPQSSYDELIRQEWPGFTSKEAFGDFARAFSADGLRKFHGMADVSATSTISHDGLVNTIKVSKPNSADELMIVVTQKGAHTVSVEAGFNGAKFFEGSWSKAEYMHFATDLRSGMLHNSDVFAGKIDPLSWRQAATSMSQTWSSDLAARASLFRQAGDTDALVLTRMQDFQAVEKAYGDFGAAAKYDDLAGSNGASTSNGLSIGDRAHFDLHAAQEKFVLAKQTFEAQHPQLSADGLLHGLEDLRIASVNERPRGVGAGGAWSRPEANTTGYHVVEGNRTIHYDSGGTLTEVHVSLNGTTDRFVVRDADGLHVLGDGAENFAVRGLDDGGFRIYDADGLMQRYGPDGAHLGDGVSVVNGNGFRGDRFVEVDGVAGARLVDLQGTHVPRTTVDLLPDGGFRVNGAQGNSTRYGVDGVLTADGLRLTDPQGLRGALFTEPNANGGLQVVDVNGRPVPNTHATELPNGQTMVVDDGLHDVQWFGRDGVRQGIGVQALHADFPNSQVFLFRAAGGNVSFVDHLGAQLPHQVDVLQGGGFRVTDPANGIARTFDDAGAAIDRRIPLHQPEVQPGQQLVVVHDVHGNLSLRTAADAPGVGTIELTGANGYRVVDGGNYHVYDADGAHQARGVAVTLQGEDGFLEIGAAGAQRVDAQYAPIAGRQVNFDAARGEITVSRVGGEDVFNLQGVPIRQATDLDGLGASQLGGRVTRADDGTVTFVDNAGAAMPNRYHATVDAQGNVRVEIQLHGSPRNGEYHVYSRGGNLTEQGFPVLNNGEATPFRYVVDRANSTWTRTGGTRADGVFQHGKVEVTGVGNGQIKLISSSAKEVQVFERRWLPGGEIMDSFRKTDTLGFGTFNRRTTWATYDNAGGISNWGKREFDTSGNSWLDVDHNGRSVHHYQQGLQKYDNPIADEIGPMGKAEKEITGHVLATRGADGNWTWNRFDADGGLLGSGQRTWESLGDGFTDRVRLPGQTTDEIAQQKWGTWNRAEHANQYKEFKLETGANGLERPGSWEIQGKAGKPVGSGTKLPNDDILSAHRVGEQRPPVWFRDYIQRNPVPEGNVSHVANDARYQIYRWETTGANNPGHGVRYVAGDESFVDVGLDGRFVRFEGKLHDGSKLKVGDQIEALTDAHPNPNGGAVTAWENDGTKGWRIFDNTNNSWQDFKPSMGPHQPGQGPDWILVRQSRPGGEVREFPEAGNNHIWVQRDAHGNLVGSSHQIPPYGHNPPIRYIEATGPADGSRWTWRELDANGTETGVGGGRFHFKGSRDQSISWDNSFRDFDARGNLVRDRQMLDEGRYVESWKSGNNNWHSAEFDKLGQRVDAAMTFDRRWSNGTGRWSGQWNAQSTHFRDVTPNGSAVPDQVRFETPQHIGDSRPVRVREYTVDANGNSDLAQWKEFDIDKIVRERALSGANYLETDKLHGQWKLWGQDGRVIGERSDTGLVFELRDNRLILTGNEFDFRGSMTEFRGWNARIGDAQRQPWHMQSDWTFDPKRLQVGSDPLRVESNYVSYGRLLTQKMLLTATTEFVLDYAASVIILAIIAEAQNKPFTGQDALKALMNAAVGTTLRTVAGTALTETRLGGGLRDLKQTMGNLDSGKLATNRPNNNSASWGVEWAGNTSPAKWRGGAFDYGFGMLMLPLTGFVNGTMNAAIFGVKGPDGKTHTVSGGQAVMEGLYGVATGYAVANSIGMLRTIGMGFSAGRYFQKGGIADIGVGFGLKFWEKGMASLLGPAIRQSIDPAWSRPNPQPLILPPSVTVPQNQPQPQVTSGGVILPPGVQAPQPPASQTGTP